MALKTNIIQNLLKGGEQAINNTLINPAGDFLANHGMYQFLHPNLTNPFESGSGDDLSNPALLNYVKYNQDAEQAARDANQQQGASPTPTPGENPMRSALNALTDPNSGKVQAQGNTDNQPNIKIPYSRGGDYYMNPSLAQVLLNSFNDEGEATHAAQVLNHPKDDPYLSGDPKSIDHNTYGENATFQTNNIDRTNDDGSIDRGLFRINSRTFNGWMSNPHSRQKMAEKGITNWDDMNDAQKNTDFARMLEDARGGNYSAWFAAPKDMRRGNYQPGQAGFIQMHPK